MVEQNVRIALSVADRGYVLQAGEIVPADTATNLPASDTIHRSYLGDG